ncbi:MAG: hypothetical protein ABR499_11180 [Gemmatimonadaceae bacterium]
MTHSVLLTSLIASLPVAQLREPAPSSWARATIGMRNVSLADSVRTRRAARRAQEKFESLRRAHLPFGPGGPRGQCDLQVGRLCYWHEDGESPPEVPEPERITRGRERLVALLADAARTIRGDEWITGQHVRYLIEARRNVDAIDAATECASTPWWCAALTGLALHRSGEYARADSAFAVALTAMPAAQRCKWTDVSLFLEGDVAKRYRGLSCAARAAVEDRFWWVSQPLYALGGNDARTEFFARRTMARLEEHAPSAYNLSWGRDVEELLMRYGWPTWWTRDRPSGVSATAGPPSIVGHEPTPSFYFHPTHRLLDANPAEARLEDWQPRMARPPARYAPAYAGGFSDLETQVAVFRRMDSALVIAAYEHPDDSLFDDNAVDAALAVGRDEATPMVVVRRTRDRRAAEPLVARVAWGPMLVSVELTAPRRRGVARARFGANPDARLRTGRLSLSDVLLYRSTDSAAASLEDVASRALGAPRGPAGGRVGVYWEIYGVRPEGEALSVTLNVERVRVGWTTRAAERLGLAAKVTPLRVRWHEVPKRDAGFASRAMTVDLSELPAGRYRMHLTVAAEDGSAAASERFIELTAAR